MTEQATQSKSVEDFLKAVFTLQQQSERVSTNTLRDALNITAPSVTDMAQRLVAAGLVDYQKYRGVVLTDAGREIALQGDPPSPPDRTLPDARTGLRTARSSRRSRAAGTRRLRPLRRGDCAQAGQPADRPARRPDPSPEGVIAQRDLQPLTASTPGAQATISRLKTSNSGDAPAHARPGFPAERARRSRRRATRSTDRSPCSSTANAASSGIRSPKIFSSPPSRRETDEESRPAAAKASFASVSPYKYLRKKCSTFC